MQRQSTQQLYLILFLCLPFICIAQTQTVQVFDNPSDTTGDLSGQIDFDRAEDRNLTIVWQDSGEHGTDWHVYVKQNHGGYIFLGRTGDGEVNRLNWSSDSPNIAPEFSTGPQFETSYSFLVFRLDGQIDEEDVFFQNGFVLLVEEGKDPPESEPFQLPLTTKRVVSVYDNPGDLQSIDATNADTDELGSQALQIAWDFSADSSTVRDYHIQVSVNNGPYQFLGQTFTGSLNYFWWMPNSTFKTASPFVNGPQDGERYRFRIVLLPYSGERDFLVSSAVSYSLQTPTPTPTPIPIPDFTPTPTPTPISEPLEETITVEISDLASQATPLEMVLIPSGDFQMGSPENEMERESNEGPVHSVTLTYPFYISRYEITQAQWEAVMGTNPGFFKENDRPVQNVSWIDCAQFCNTLSSLKGKNPVYDESDWSLILSADGFRMPTEAEWEFACRAGSTTRYFWGIDSEHAAVGDYAWYYNNADMQPHPIGEKLPNPWELFDINGNVWEWCSDWYGAYPDEARIDPFGPETGTERVVRGGGWESEPFELRSASRERLAPEETFGNLGLRIVLPLTQ